MLLWHLTVLREACRSFFSVFSLVLREACRCFFCFFILHCGCYYLRAVVTFSLLMWRLTVLRDACRCFFPVFSKGHARTSSMGPARTPVHDLGTSKTDNYTCNQNMRFLKVSAKPVTRHATDRMEHINYPARLRLLEYSLGTISTISSPGTFCIVNNSTK